MKLVGYILFVFISTWPQEQLKSSELLNFPPYGENSGCRVGKKSFWKTSVNFRSSFRLLLWSLTLTCRKHWSNGLTVGWSNCMFYPNPWPIGRLLQLCEKLKCDHCRTLNITGINASIRRIQKRFGVVVSTLSLLISRQKQKNKKIALCLVFSLSNLL